MTFRNGIRPTTACPARPKASPRRGEKLPTLLLFAAVLFIPSTLKAADEKEEVSPEPDRSRLLFIMNADGTDLRQLAFLPAYTAQGSPNWSSDGQRIAFDAWQPDVGRHHRDAHVFVINPDGSEPRDLGPGAMPNWSPGGKRITFSQYSPNQGVWIMNADGGDRELLDAAGWSAQWSPDGRKIAYATYRDGPNICIYDVIEDDRQMIFEGGDHDYRQIRWNFTWSPDSRQLCFKGLREDGTSDIAIVSARGARHGFDVRLSERASELIAWRPDGLQLLVSIRSPERQSFQLFAVDPDTDGLPIVFKGQDPDRNNADPAWSPDGKQVVFASWQARRRAER